MHLLFVGIFFFGYRDSATSRTFIMHNHTLNTQVAVVLAPSRSATTQTHTEKQTGSAKINNQKNAQFKKAPTQIAQPAVAKTLASKPKPPTKAIQPKVAKKPAIAKPNANKKTVAAKPSVVKKVEPKKIESAKPVPIKKTEAAHVEKPKTIDEKTIKPSSIAEKTQPNQSISEQVAAVAPVVQHIDTQTITIEIPYNQAREFYQQEALRKELAKHWTPPHGIPDTCSCEITTYVDTNGVITDSVISQSSGILMYDVSARAAILAMELPRWTWGSSFTITFKP
jgi:hypothetical protein